MRVSSQSWFWAAAFALAALAGASAQEPELSARDIFRKAGGALGPARKPAKEAQPKKSSRPASEKLTKAPDPEPRTEPPPKPEQEQVSADESKTQQAAVEQPKQTPPDRPATSPDGQGQVVLASLESEIPLALRYSLEKDMGGGRGSEVVADTVFRSGDRIRINVQSNQQAYLYLILQGSSGRWQVLFPSKDIHGGANLVEAYQDYVAPPPDVGWFAFDDQVGAEKLFVMLSRRRVKDIDSLIYEMATPPDAATPTVPAQPEALFVLTQNIPSIDDALVGRLRNEVYARDLVFERVDEKSEQGEAAVYVAAKEASEDSRVVVDVSLKHR